ncbi:MAG: efflux RND transporter periplasmic adaptor subunit [Deltaproteobacteria bacterium]|nr:efflux RND transporter periplasmic adaptor subunit [Deltaproteobacteria bacterium]
MKSRSYIKGTLVSLAVGLLLILMVMANLNCSRQADDHAAEPEPGHSSHEVDDEHEGQEEHQNHNNHDEKGHEDHDEEQIVRMTDDELREFGVEIRSAGPGELAVQLSLPGEIVANPDRLAHIVPRVLGVVSETHKTLGDEVTEGELMAVLSSRELADAKSDYLAARSRTSLAWQNYSREKELWNKKITSKQEYLEAKNAWSEARIERKSAEQKLHALGLSHEDIEKLPNQPDTEFTRFEIIAPFDGSVIEKHITLGEVVNDESEVFVVADLRTVWVNITVYEKDLNLIEVGQEVLIRSRQSSTEATGKIDYISPIIDESTRTANARVILENAGGTWRPGQFVNVMISREKVKIDLAVPLSAIQQIDSMEVVFVRTREGMEPRPVTTGRSDTTSVEILSGLKAGEPYAATNSFILKAELGKQSFGDGHGH